MKEKQKRSDSEKRKSYKALLTPCSSSPKAQFGSRKADEVKPVDNLAIKGICI